ncbi:MAG TPA: hypothetical protein PLP22_01695 [Candidatus Competibacter sp.]|nr:hypothetical protein [Candidatus Competibacter sp.]HUM93423.1 hypothetical protein [Candidatus Competibacter sp.]
MERIFGARRLDRSTRKLSLTPCGDVFYQHARRTLEAVDAAVGHAVSTTPFAEWGFPAFAAKSNSAFLPRGLPIRCVPSAG